MNIQQRYRELNLWSGNCIATRDKVLAVKLKIEAIQVAKIAGEGPLTPELVDIYNKTINLDRKPSQVVIVNIEEETVRLLGL